MPGNYHWSVDMLVEEVRSAKSLGIGGVMLFGIPEKKDDLASGAYDDHGIVQQAVRALKREVPGILLITDVCLANTRPTAIAAWFRATRSLTTKAWTCSPERPFLKPKPARISSLLQT